MIAQEFRNTIPILLTSRFTPLYHSQDERCLPILSLGVDFGSMAKKKYGGLEITALRSRMKRRESSVLGSIHISSMVNQRLDDWHIPSSQRGVQRHHPTRALGNGINRRLPLQQYPYGFRVTKE